MKAHIVVIDEYDIQRSRSCSLDKRRFSHEDNRCSLLEFIQDGLLNNDVMRLSCNQLYSVSPWPVNTPPEESYYVASMSSDKRTASTQMCPNNYTQVALQPQYKSRKHNSIYRWMQKEGFANEGISTKKDFCNSLISLKWLVMNFVHR